MKTAPDFVPCPGCGALAVPTAGAPAFTRCSRCATPLVVLNRDLDVERAVRELAGRRARPN